MEAVLLMTGSGTVTILAYRFVTAIRAFVLVGSVVSGMATGTVGLVRCVLPGNDFRVALMAVGTRQVSAMILRLVCQCRVTIIGGRPGICAVARIALLRGAEVIRVLANSLHPVVTGGA